MSLINKILHYHYLITPIFYCIWIDFMQIFTENVFKKIRHSRRLMGIRRYTRDRLKTKSSTLKDYKIIHQSYFNIYFQNTNFMQLVYYSFLFLYVYTQLQKCCHRKMKKGKSQIGINSANLATFSWWIHLQSLHFPAGIFRFIVFQL